MDTGSSDESKLHDGSHGTVGATASLAAAGAAYQLHCWECFARVDVCPTEGCENSPEATAKMPRGYQEIDGVLRCCVCHAAAENSCAGCGTPAKLARVARLKDCSPDLISKYEKCHKHLQKTSEEDKIWKLVRTKARTDCDWSEFQEEHADTLHELREAIINHFNTFPPEQAGDMVVDNWLPHNVFNLSGSLLKDCSGILDCFPPSLDKAKRMQAKAFGDLPECHITRLMEHIIGQCTELRIPDDHPTTRDFEGITITGNPDAVFKGCPVQIRVVQGLDKATKVENKINAGLQQLGVCQFVCDAKAGYLVLLDTSTPRILCLAVPDENQDICTEQWKCWRKYPSFKLAWDMCQEYEFEGRTPEVMAKLTKKARDLTIGGTKDMCLHCGLHLCFRRVAGVRCHHGDRCWECHFETCQGVCETCSIPKRYHRSGCPGRCSACKGVDIPCYFNERCKHRNSYCALCHCPRRRSYGSRRRRNYR